MSAIARPLDSGYFESAIPDTNLGIQFSLDVMDRLNGVVMEGFKAVPRRGLEVGGLLLGRVEGDRVIVEEFAAVDSEHHRGPSWVLSEKDKLRLAEAVLRENDSESGTRVVGLYRSQTRADFAPAEEDAALMAEYCAGSGRVFLLVRPEPGMRSTALFAAGDGLRATSETFPFRGGSSAPRVRAPLAPSRAVNAALPAAPSADEPARIEHVPRLRMARVMDGLAADLDLTPVSAHSTNPQAGLFYRIALTLGILLCAGAGGYGLARWWTAFTRPAMAPSSSLALHAIWSGASLDLQWNRDSPLIRQATGGVLWIDDGSQQRRLDMKAEDLTQGSIQYWPKSSDVNFKLEVNVPGGSASESMRALSVPLPPPVTPAVKPLPAVDSKAPAAVSRTGARHSRK